MAERTRIGIVGARGYVGGELVRLLAAHPDFELAFVSSRELAGQPLDASIAGAPRGLAFERLEPMDVARKEVEAVVLALPNGRAAAFVEAVRARTPGAVLVDLSADHRFDDAWYYGLPELTREASRDQRLISNPGCYATAMQLAIAPMRDVLEGPVQCFGVSGWSGAGTSPSDKNDPDKLRDNLMPYALVDHLHEREVSRHLAHPVEFMPHVAAHFRGITLTANLHLTRHFDREAVMARFHQRYDDEPLVEVVDPAPWVSRIAGRHGVQVGGFTLSADGRRLVVVATLDNLLKGAATQALQNLNRAFGLPELTGIPHDPRMP
ncbi:N-acetyl-gamma-glutamyl-phosphate reductase [Alkalisalibacterium limincola]|uniref:N-acetyl-gamma-glutamyl-phosphate reductase n=1 Tax=Alkalisalibacterium limincola TaxID=2699169 RepID=A0A5C8KVK9_9GAMM|nr:N-acetyl-gamma-glutamyl-phosphate reductase [Alkalisalibacterium limincola]TXK65809.1 N-acetyl-gamma-glutamyl-phosphate reductase [Alkalisalibacterium limincola]